MKEYPSICGASRAPRQPCIAFYKYDGSNLRFEWSKKRGWYKFGTRHRMFDQTDEVFGVAVKLFNETIAPVIDPILKKEWRDSQEFIVFCEFFGDKSFAGQHNNNDHTRKLVLFDVNVHKQGFVSPREFSKIFSPLDIGAKVVYDGNLNESFIQQVRENTLPGVTLNEGVVCKGGIKHDRWMAKIKTNAYIQKLKDTFSGDWQKYGEE